MIPKIIHYCWFGKNYKDDRILNCINSWKIHCPDYEIIEWNEDNFNVNNFEYTKYAYENKCWSKVSNFVRVQLYLIGKIKVSQYLHFPKFVSRLLGNKFKTIVGNLRGKTLEEALREPTIVKFSGGKPERYSNLLGPICQNAAFMSDETLEREADACVTFDYPAMDEDFLRHL